jgi:hypothetical protein
MRSGQQHLDERAASLAETFFRTALSSALQLSPGESHDTRRSKLFRVYIKLGQTNIRLQEFDQAEDYLRVAEAHIANSEERKLYCYYKALSMMKNRNVVPDTAKIVALYTEAIEIDPTWAKAFVLVPMST